MTTSSGDESEAFCRVVAKLAGRTKALTSSSSSSSESSISTIDSGRSLQDNQKIVVLDGIPLQKIHKNSKEIRNKIQIHHPVTTNADEPSENEFSFVDDEELFVAIEQRLANAPLTKAAPKTPQREPTPESDNDLDLPQSMDVKNVSGIVLRHDSEPNDDEVSMDDQELLNLIESISNQVEPTPTVEKLSSMQAEASPYFSVGDDRFAVADTPVIATKVQESHPLGVKATTPDHDNTDAPAEDARLQVTGYRTVETFPRATQLAAPEIVAPSISIPKAKKPAIRRATRPAAPEIQAPSNSIPKPKQPAARYSKRLPSTVSVSEAFLHAKAALEKAHNRSYLTSPSTSAESTTESITPRRNKTTTPMAPSTSAESSTESPTPQWNETTATLAHSESPASCTKSEKEYMLRAIAEASCGAAVDLSTTGEMRHCNDGEVEDAFFMPSSEMAPLDKAVEPTFEHQVGTGIVPYRRDPPVYSDGYQLDPNNEIACMYEMQHEQDHVDDTAMADGIETDKRESEIGVEYYRPREHERQAEPIVHKYSVSNRPLHQRKQLPVAQVFQPPVNSLWKNKFDTFNQLQSEMSNLLAMRYEVNCGWNVQTLNEFSSFSNFRIRFSTHSDDNIVVSAPTGAGKTVVFEMAMARFFSVDLQANRSKQVKRAHISKNRKMVYISPSKALCEERMDDWTTRLSAMSLGIEVALVTGDGNPSEAFRDIASAHLVLTTPEKWDSLTRRWTENFVLFASFKLFLCDEIHLVADKSRGSCLESVICRMKTIHRAAYNCKFTQDAIDTSRFVMLDSCKLNACSLRITLTILRLSLASLQLQWDISRSYQFRHACRRRVSYAAKYRGYRGFSRCRRGSYVLDCFSLPKNYCSLPFSTILLLAVSADVFDETYRPVPLTTYVVGQGLIGENSFRFWSGLNKNVPEIVMRYSKQRPAIIFCHSKADTEKLADLLANAKGICLQGNANQEIASQTRISKLQRVLYRGIAYHHAGLELDDRRLVEKAFLNGKIRALCATSTLAMGVNLPAHLVVIKGTMAWRGGTNGYQDIDQASLVSLTKGWDKLYRVFL
jgi:hypothetical protein